MGKDRSTEIWSELGTILKQHLKVSAKSLKPVEAKKQMKALDAQRKIILDVLRRALLREMGWLKVDFDRDENSQELTIDLLGDIVIRQHYKGRVTNRPLRLDMEEVIREVYEEIKGLYRHLRKVVGFSRDSNQKQKKRRDEALRYYEEQKGKLRFVRREYLEDWSLYSFAPGQEKRDFEGRLLMKIAEDRGLGKISARDAVGILRGMKTDQNQ